MAPPGPHQLQQLLDRATGRLGLTIAARCLYTSSGKKVTAADLSVVSEGTVPTLYVSIGEDFIDPQVVGFRKFRLLNIS